VYTSGFARLASGAFYETIVLVTLYEIIILYVLWKIRNLPHHSKNYLQGQNLKITANYPFFCENISGMGP
jgi:hypothetical protein